MPDEKDYVKVEIFQHQQDCQKPHDTCEPIKVELQSVKDRMADNEESIKEIKADLKAGMIWVIGLLVAIIGSGAYIMFEHFVSKNVGG